MKQLIIIVILLLSHHPIIFNPIKKLTNSNFSEKLIYKAVKNDIAIYAIHTNLDNIYGGVSFTIAKKLNLLNSKILNPKEKTLTKLITYCPNEALNSIQNELFKIGAGKVRDKYDQCSFISEGLGGFRPLNNANPF